MRAMTTKIKLGDIIMDAVVDENAMRLAETTDKPVEQGQDISDHMKLKPYTVKLTGSMVKDAASKIATLIKYQKESKLLTYVGRGVYKDMVIINLNTKHSVTNAKGFDYEITIQNVRVAKPETFEVRLKNPDTGKQDKKTATRVRAKTNDGRQQLSDTAHKLAANAMTIGGVSKFVLTMKSLGGGHGGGGR